MDVVSLGEVLVDMFPAELGRPLEDVTSFRPVPGGAPANVAVAAVRLGMSGAFIGKVGDDAFGHHLASVLAQQGVDVAGMRYDAYARTGINFMAQPDANNYVCLFYRNPGADMLLEPAELDQELLRSARALHFGSLSLAQEPSRGATLAAIRLARSGGALISFDVNYRPTLWPSPEEACRQVAPVVAQADLLKVNEAELGLLSGTTDLAVGSAALLERGPRLCVVTLGPGGSYFRTAAGDDGFVPGFQIETVDATGCGDAFIAGLLSQLLAAGGLTAFPPSADAMRATVRYANAVGALTATKQGVIPSLPSAADVVRFLQS